MGPKYDKIIILFGSDILRFRIKKYIILFGWIFYVKYFFRKLGSIEFFLIQVKII